MKKVIKFSVLIYFTSALIALLFIANYFVLKSNPDIYKIIPQDADIIIEINTKNFIKEIAYQRVYNEDYFLEKIPTTGEETILEEAPVNTGIDFFSQIIFT